jgi:hypothetical protein
MTRFYILRLTLKHNAIAFATVVMAAGLIIAAMLFLGLFFLLANKHLL